MKKTIFVAAMILALIPCLSFGQSRDYYDRSYVRMSYVQGDVSVQRAGDMGYEQGEVNLVVVEGDKLGTKDGRVELQLGRQNFLRLDRFTQLDVIALPRQDGDATNFHVLAGCLYLRVNALDGERNIQIHTPDASFYVFEKGLYRIEVRENEETEFRVFYGRAEVAGEDGSVVANGGQQVRASDGRIVSGPDSLSANNDAFAAWNDDREGLYDRRVERAYLPSEYAEYESELADNGQWVEELPYGNVWVPRVAYDDWRPYYEGRWSYYSDIGWTWLPYESWGWCTMHYGRWGWRFGLGWYWIPHNHWGWGPAWVGWYWDHDYVGWAPLSYYDYPGVLLGRTFHDRYNDGYYPNGSRALTVIRRDQLQGRLNPHTALTGDEVHRVGLMSLRRSQPFLTPSVDRTSATAMRAKTILSRDSLRRVERNFEAGGKRLTQDDIRTGKRNRVLNDGTADNRKTVMKNGQTPKNPDSSVHKIGPTGAGTSPALKRESGFTGDGLKSPTPVHSAAPMRSFPSRTISPVDRGGSNTRPDSVSPPQIRRSVESPNTIGRSPIQERPRIDSPVRNISPRNNEAQPPKNVVPDRAIKERKLPEERSSSSSQRFAQRPAIPSAPSRSSSPSSSRLSSPPRVSSAPVPSRSYSAPSRSVSPPSRSYSAPSRSVSPPSRSYSAPSHSISPPSRSYSAPSRSASPPSRSSGSSSSRSSGGGGTIRKK